MGLQLIWDLLHPFPQLCQLLNAVGFLKQLPADHPTLFTCLKHKDPQPLVVFNGSSAQTNLNVHDFGPPGLKQ